MCSRRGGLSIIYGVPSKTRNPKPSPRTHTRVRVVCVHIRSMCAKRRPATPTRLAVRGWMAATPGKQHRSGSRLAWCWQVLAQQAGGSWGGWGVCRWRGGVHNVCNVCGTISFTTHSAHRRRRRQYQRAHIYLCSFVRHLSRLAVGRLRNWHAIWISLHDIWSDTHTRTHARIIVVINHRHQRYNLRYSLP